MSKKKAKANVPEQVKKLVTMKFEIAVEVTVNPDEVEHLEGYFMAISDQIHNRAEEVIADFGPDIEHSASTWRVKSIQDADKVGRLGSLDID